MSLARISDEEKVTVSMDEVAGVARLLNSPYALPAAPAKDAVPVWAVALLSPSVLCLPVLCLLAVVLRVALKKSSRPLRAAWDRLLITLLVVSGLLSSLIFAYFIAVPARRGVPLMTSQRRPLALTHSLPHFPSAVALSAQRLAEEAWDAVFIVAPDSSGSASPSLLENASIGAATLLMADSRGYLLATSRHVVDEKTFGFTREASRMALFSHDREYASAEVVGRHDGADIALLWAERKSSGENYCQPVARESHLAMGEPVFVIGHPQRLFFTLSSGLVSRTEDNDVLQISAPVSPGNSGGPVYDTNGYLLGVVAFMIDRAQNPNAENLNFAVRSDKLLSREGWSFSGPGKAELESFIRSQNRKAPPL